MINPAYNDALGLRENALKQIIRNTTLASPAAFFARYHKDEKGEDVVLKDFHVKLLDVLTNPEIKRALVLLPAGHGKTTVTRGACEYLVAKDPNIRIMHIMNNSTDAEQNLSALEMTLTDERSPLVQEHGPFKGKVWKSTEFHVAGRTIIDKDPTFAAYGTGSNVFGHRADLVICDDILNLDNSGPFVTDRTRQGVHDWFFQGVMKVAAPYGRVIVIGTVMDFRDLYHELMDPKHGFTVLKMQAILDEEKQEVLWPERFTYDWLRQERESDMTSFMKRFQNVALEDALLTFPMKDLTACLDYNRPMGVVTKEMIESGHTVIVNAFDPTSGQTKGSKWCGFASLAFNPKEADPKKIHVVELGHFRAPFEEQIDFIIDRHMKYGATASVIEANGAHQYLMQSQRLRAFRESGNRVVPHFTHERNKPDPFVGIPAVAEVIKAHRMTFPFADANARKWIGFAIEHEFGTHPMAETTDILMAVWFAWLWIKNSSPNRMNVVKRKLPLWARGSGLLPRQKAVVSG